MLITQTKKPLESYLVMRADFLEIGWSFQQFISTMKGNPTFSHMLVTVKCHNLTVVKVKKNKKV